MKEECYMTINEIAELAGVSRATVSRYLNEGYVSAEKREAIRRVIEETGYEPSVQAQNLRKKVTKLIGVIIPRIQSDSIGRMVAGISSILSEAGYQLLLANTQNDAEEELKYLKVFGKNQVDGIILIGTMFSKAHFKLMKEAEVPIVVLGQQLEDYTCVYQDDYLAAKEVTRKLLENSEKIGYIGVTKKDIAVGERRLNGFLDALSEKERSISEDAMQIADFSIESGYEKAKVLLEKEPDTDAIFCATDSIAVGVLKYLHEKKIAVPEQIRLMGFGDTQIGSVVSPAIATVHFFYKTTGMEAARLLLEIIDTGKDLKKTLKMGFELKEKESLQKIER